MEYTNSTVQNVVATQSSVLKPKTLPETIVSALNDRIADEYAAHYLYRGAANWCAGVNYKKAAAFFAAEAAAELEHSEKLSLTQIFEGMEKILDTTLLGYQKCIIQYKIYGQESGTWHFEIYKGEAVLRNFEHENPQLEMCVDYKTWMSIVNGEITGEMAFSQGLIKAEGDFQILIQHDELFNRELLQEIER